MIEFKKRKLFIHGNKAVRKSRTAAWVTDYIYRTFYRLCAKAGEEYIIKPAYEPDNGPENEKEDYKSDHKKSMTSTKISPGEG